MKKVLLSTSAIALAGAVAAPANAADWDVRVGGYYNAMVAYASTDGNGVTGQDFDGVDVSTNAEIFFLPRIMLDNGIEIGANVQLEGETSGDQIDESYVYIKGSFGEVDIGSENSAGYKMTYAAPNAAIIALNSPSTPDYIAWTGGVDGVGRNTLGTTFLEVAANNDAKRITYYTPRFAGFQLGLSYAHDANQDDFGPTDLNAAGAVGQIFDIGANYVQSFGDFNVAASARWGIGSQEGQSARNTVSVARDGTITSTAPGGTVPAGDTVLAAGRSALPSTNPTVYAFGLNLGYAGFTIGGSWAESNETNGGIDDGIAYDAGVSYATGPWTFSATYFHGENGEPGGLRDKQDTYGGAVDYKLAKGVRLNLFGAYVDLNAAAPGGDIDGWVIGTGIGLSF